MNCEIANGKCVYCFWKNKTKHPDSVISRSCTNRPCKHLQQKTPEQFPPPNGLGDAMADTFAAVGVTKERFTNAVNLWNKSDEKKDCGCTARQKGMNWIGEKLGLPKGKGAELQQLIELTDLPQQPVHECIKHGKCLTQLRLETEQRDIVIEAGYTPCHGCGDFEAATTEP